MEQRWNDTDRINKNYPRNACSNNNLFPHISYGQDYQVTRAFVVKGRRPTNRNKAGQTVESFGIN